MKRISKALCLFMTAVMLLSLSLPVWATGDTLLIHTPEDLAALAEQCSLDSWSRGKTVRLEADLDLSGTDFTPIPTFGGTFEGNGHTISGLSLTQPGSVRGLFRYLQPDGIIRDLTVAGTISPSGSKSTVGGIVGQNLGLITGCTFRGVVCGTNNVGGIVGLNEGQGRLIDCVFSGSVTGEHYIGGIAGQNLGSLVQCRNQGSVNATDVESGSGLESLDLDDLNSTENLPSSTDIGGVTGFSAGIVQSCRNTGTVGYPHVGYNVGGVVGRQAGYLDGCINSGSVYGRKDVGGIAGQMEPSLSLQYREDILDRLWSELDALQSLMDRTLDNADNTSGSINASISSLTDRTGVVKDKTGDLTDAMGDWISDNVNSIQDVTARVSWALDQLAPVTEDLTDAFDALEHAMSKLSDAMDSGASFSGLGSEAADSLDQARRQMKKALQQTKQAVQNVQSAKQALLNALLTGDEEEMKAAIQALENASSSFRNSISSLKSAAGHLADMIRTLSQAGDQGKDLFHELGSMADQLEDATGSLEDVSQGLWDIVEDLANRPAIEFRPIDSAITEKSDALENSMTDLLDGMDDLTNTLSQSKEVILDDLRAINQQLGRVIDVLHQAVDDAKNPDKKEPDHYFEDISDQEVTTDTGLLSSSRNTGSVAGDVNVAGIVGSIAVEYDFDPEDDLTSAGSHSLDFRFQALAVVRNCINQGEVTAKKDCAGGITGRMDLGRISGCESYGPVSSSDGDYVGGIAGASYAVIRDSWVKCALSGGDYIGGVAGYATTLLGCRSLVSIDEGNEYLGSVAGDIDPEGRLDQNLYVPETTAAVDGISYAGRAEAAAFPDLEAAGGMPDGFRQFQLTFLADEQVVATIPFSYGDGLEALPPVPKKEGYSGKWPDLDLAHLTFSRTLEAIYTPYSSSMSGDASEIPELLVDGSFSDEAVVTHTSAPASWTDSYGLSHSGTAYTVTVTDPLLPAPSYTIHYRLPNPKEQYTLWVKEGHDWKQQKFQLDGSYLLLPNSSESITFCVVEQGVALWIWLLAGAGILLACAGGVVLVKKRKRPRIKIGKD